MFASVPVAGVMGDSAKMAKLAAEAGEKAKITTAIAKATGIIKIPLSELRPTHYPVKSAAEMQKLVDDIKINGVKESVKFIKHNGENYIVDGHHRYFAALKIGLKDIPVQEVKLPYLGYSTLTDLSLDGRMLGYWQYLK